MHDISLGVVFFGPKTLVTGTFARSAARSRDARAYDAVGTIGTFLRVGYDGPIVAEPYIARRKRRADNGQCTRQGVCGVKSDWWGCNQGLGVDETTEYEDQGAVVL